MVKKLMFLLIFMVSIAGYSYSGGINTQQEFRLAADHVADNGTVTWPWGMPLPIPWEELTGVWSMPVSPSERAIFTFSVVNQRDGDKTLKVEQWDQNTCANLASGVGYEGKQNQVQGQMAGSANYRFVISVFKKDPDLMKRGFRIDRDGEVKVFTVLPVKIGSGNPRDFQVFKVDNSPKFTCVPRGSRNNRR